MKAPCSRMIFIIPSILSIYIDKDTTPRTKIDKELCSGNTQNEYTLFYVSDATSRQETNAQINTCEIICIFIFLFRIPRSRCAAIHSKTFYYLFNKLFFLRC